MNSNQSLTLLLKRLWLHISPVRRKQFGLLLFLTILSSFAEIASLSAVIPFIAIITQPDLIFNYPFIVNLIEFFGIKKGTDLVIPLTIAFLLASIVSVSKIGDWKFLSY